MAKAKSTLVEYSGTIDKEIHYKRFGRTYTRRLPAEYNDRQSEAQLRQRALFKTRQRLSALYGTILQRGLTKEAHQEGMTEANYFSRLNNHLFHYEDGEVHVDYAALRLASGPLPVVDITEFHADSLHVEISYAPHLENYKSRPDDVVHFYAVSPEAEYCDLLASVERPVGQVSFDLPDLSDETDTKQSPTFYLYALVESKVTANVPTLSADEKHAHKRHRNIDRKVSRSVFVGVMKE